MNVPSCRPPIWRMQRIEAMLCAGEVVNATVAAREMEVSIPDNRGIPDVKGQSFNDLLNQNKTGYLDAPARPAPVVPNRIDEIKAGAANAGKPDGGFKDTGIIAAVDRCTSAVNGISLKNK